MIGSTGVVWLDADGDGLPTSAYEYARRLVDKFEQNIAGLLDRLSSYDEAVATQAANLLHKRSISTN
ncbi:MAG: hypothetical protein ACRD1R_12210 [Acidobacteriota bacterium]